jgi:DNA-directed RNA polymerase specialized sigma24 family protein
MALFCERRRRSRPAEAAVRLGIPEGTVFSRSYYALRVLRGELGVPGRGLRGGWVS